MSFVRIVRWFVNAVKWFGYFARWFIRVVRWLGNSYRSFGNSCKLFGNFAGSPGRVFKPLNNFTKWSGRIVFELVLTVKTPGVFILFSRSEGHMGLLWRSPTELSWLHREPLMGRSHTKYFFIISLAKFAKYANLFYLLY